MSYRPIAYQHIAEEPLRTIFHRADLYVSDVYSMFFTPYKGWRSGGGCNFPIVLTLLCVVDGIARDIYPTRAAEDDQETRFKKLLRDKLFWGPLDKGWMDKSEAAKLLYLEFRNPLVHELGKDSLQGRVDQNLKNRSSESGGRYRQTDRTLIESTA